MTTSTRLRTYIKASLAVMLILMFNSCLEITFWPEQNQDQTIVTENEDELRLGISLEGFKRLFPYAVNISNDRYSRRSIEYGLRGEWIYSFHEGRLSWYSFKADAGEVNQEQFSRTYTATNSLIENFSNQYGNPWRQDQGYTEFINPAERSHSGYKVKEAQWRTPDGYLVVDFTFLGDNGKYSLLLTVVATS